MLTDNVDIVTSNTAYRTEIKRLIDYNHTVTQESLHISLSNEKINY